MRTELEIVKDDGVLVVRVTGALEGYRATWQKKVDKAIEKSGGDVMLNLEKARFIDSRGMGYLFSTHKTLNAAGRRLFLVLKGPEVRDALDTAGVTELLRVYESEEQAKAAM